MRKLKYAIVPIISFMCLPAAIAQAQHSMHGSQMQKPMTMGEHTKMMTQHKDHMVHMLGKKDSKYDLRFINMMIQHHEGAIAMAKNAIRNASHSEIRELSQKIIDSQQLEIDQLKNWRKQWYGQ